MRAVAELVSNAIDQSLESGDIVRIITGDGVTAADCRAAARLLDHECEGSADGDDVAEYWGSNVDGNEWRVHVEMA